jgi:hypothetical protein
VCRYVNLGRCPADVLVIDEISMVDAALFSELMKLKLFGKQFLVLGDYNQFPPIANSWKGCKLEATSEAALVDLAEHRVTLMENRRSDPALFAAYSSLVEGGMLNITPLAGCLAQLKPHFPRTAAPARWNLVMSHLRRVKLNRELNCREAGRDAVVIPGREPMLVWPGLLLIGCATSGPVRNSCFYEVLAADPERITIASEEGAVELTHAAACRLLRLSYALTYASCQGLTLEGRVRLWDVNSKHFTKTHLFVALSRATAANLVEIV